MHAPDEVRAVSRSHSLAGFARAVIVDDRIFVSGTVGVDPASGHMPDTPEAQTQLALDTIEKALIEAASGLQDIVLTRVHIPDPELVLRVSMVTRDRIGFVRPANTTVCSPLAVPGAHVEIEVQAIRGSGTAH